VTVDTKLSTIASPRTPAVLIAAVLMAMAASTGSAVERVVLGEYFTNLF
jgi:hypothetical protein